jgi:tetratricopeptide (TPR) repeat protein
MRSAPDFASHFEHARKLHAEGRLAKAEQAYRQLLTPGKHREFVLQALTELYLQTRHPQKAIDTLVSLTEEVPDSLFYYARLASLLDGLGQTDAAISHYQRLLKRQPEMAAAHFNLALLYKKNKLYAEALASYENAIRLGIDTVQEVYSNMGVLYSELRQANTAAEMYERALEVDPGYIPAMFNRAGLLEEAGERQRAIELYRRILTLDSRHWNSLARLIYAKKVTHADDHLIEELEHAIENAKDDLLAREGLQFALGKAMDDMERYGDAFAAYRAANAAGSLRNPPYHRSDTERAFDQLIELFHPDWIRSTATGSVASPIFICGMFRSGSTLVEQILAAHPSVTAGGELDFLPWLVGRRLSPYPERIKSVSREALRRFGEDYLSRLQELHPDSDKITDKLPDNFLHLGLIRALFPRARIVYTKRNPLDNCLSVYFQQFGGNLRYATDLGDTAHYYRQHERLMQHWKLCFGENIFTVDYDALVRSPEAVLRRLLDFLGLPWDSRCLEFQQTQSPVKSASLWQVREELYRFSSGRWRNYEPFLGDLQTSLFSGD